MAIQNLATQCTEIFKVLKTFQYKNFDIFLIFAQNKNKNNRYTLAPQFYYMYIKVEHKGVFISQKYFPDGKQLTLITIILLI